MPLIRAARSTQSWTGASVPLPRPWLTCSRVPEGKGCPPAVAPYTVYTDISGPWSFLRTSPASTSAGRPTLLTLSSWWFGW